MPRSPFVRGVRAAQALDARPHDVVAYVDMTGEWAVNHPHERVFWNLHRAGGLCAGGLGFEGWLLP